LSLERKLKTALDETRLLILGAQVLYGFQFNAAFQELFRELPRFYRYLECIALMLLMVSVALLITPSLWHRIVEQGKDTGRTLALATLCAGLALLPLASGLGLDVLVTIASIYGSTAGYLASVAFVLLALLFWYGIEIIMRRQQLTKKSEPEEESPSLATQVDQLLTEARVIIPGAQALLGFQFAVTLTRAFRELPPEVKLVHILGLFCVALAIILLMAPAALHRITFRGEAAREFVRTGSLLVIAAPVPLALGISMDTYVAAHRALESDQGALWLAGLTALVLFALWYAFPLSRRRLLS
jgi:Family of unknown function (DUF6328)